MKMSEEDQSKTELSWCCRESQMRWWCHPNHAPCGWGKEMEGPQISGVDPNGRQHLTVLVCKAMTMILQVLEHKQFC